MARKPRAIVLDSWAVMAYLEDESTAEKVAEIIADAHEEKIPLLMSVVNAGEVWYILAREVSVAEAEASVRQLRQLGIEFVNADWDLAREAGGFKAKHKMSFADCFAAALAKQRKAHLVTGDQEFKQVKQEITIEFLS
ncbi:MAG TPA: type II toxin-antitoxin system VapC family toxin [Pyrinomonadaceae bacterium]|nr:type II toxin-antitoxin system VapC family toxin [Pyrinomonadaceae bacterium]